MFERGSRYEKTTDARWIDRSGREVTYKRLRFIPSPTGIRVHRVGAEERLDLVAHTYLGDPLQFWRIADANRAMLPERLVEEPGRSLVIPLVTE